MVTPDISYKVKVAPSILPSFLVDSFLEYRCFDLEGKVFSFFSHKDYAAIASRQMALYEKHIAGFLANNTPFFLLSGTPKTGYERALWHAGLWNILYVYVRIEEYITVCAYGRDRNTHSLLEFYMNNRAVLAQLNYHVDAYMRSRYDSKPRIKALPENLFLVHSSREEDNSDQDMAESVIQDEGMAFSLREKQCLYYLCMGYTLDDTAKALNLSVRTIEFYISRARKKRGGVSRKELISLVQGSAAWKLAGTHAFR